VIIDKLPFASPSDPVTAARVDAIKAEGGDAFADYQVPLAILTLQQGLGRLIRHRSDRGVLAILDPRVKTMGYGRRFLDSLPPAPVTHDLDAVERSSSKLLAGHRLLGRAARRSFTHLNSFWRLLHADHSVPRSTGARRAPDAIGWAGPCAEHHSRKGARRQQ